MAPSYFSELIGHYILTFSLWKISNIHKNRANSPVNLYVPLTQLQQSVIHAQSLLKYVYIATFLIHPNYF